MYLGIPLGANLKKASIWKPVVEKVEKKLALWKEKVLLRVRRLTLIMAVLNNLPMYYLSLFKILKKVALMLIQL